MVAPRAARRGVRDAPHAAVGRLTSRSWAAAAALLLALLAACAPAPARGQDSYAPQWVSYVSDLEGPGTTGGGSVRGLSFALYSDAGKPASALYAGGAWYGATSLQRTGGRGDPLDAATQGGADALLMRQNPGDGSLLWSHAFGGAGDDWIADVASGGAVGGVAGAVVAAGVTASGAFSLSAASNVTVSASSVRNATTPAGFVAAFGADGTPLWAVRIGGGGGTLDLTSAPAGSPWAASEPFFERSNARSATLSPYGSDGAFGVAVAANGDVYVAGQVGPATPAFCDEAWQSGTGGAALLPTYALSIGGNTQQQPTLLRTGADAVVGKLAPGGGLAWHLRAYGSNNGSSHDVALGVAAVPTDGGVATVGATLSSILSFTLTAAPSGTVGGGTNGVNNGNAGAAVVTDLTSVLNTFLSTALSSGYVLRLSPSGDLMWAAAVTATGGAAATAVAADVGGAVIACGSRRGALSVVPIGTTTLPTVSTLDAPPQGDGSYAAGWVVKWTSQGQLQWASSIGSGTDGDAVFRVAVDGASSVYAFGTLASLSATIAGGSGSGLVLSRAANVADAQGFAVKFAAAADTSSRGQPLWAATAAAPGAGRVLAGASANATQNALLFWGGTLSANTVREGESANFTTPCRISQLVQLQPSSVAMPWAGFLTQPACIGSPPPPNALNTPPPSVINSPPPAGLAITAAPPWVAGAQGVQGDPLPLSPRAVAFSADGTRAFAAGWTVNPQGSRSGAPSKWASYYANATLSTPQTPLFSPANGGGRDAFVVASSVSVGTPIWNASFGGAGDDWVADVAAVPTVGIGAGAGAMLLAGGRFGGGTAALPGYATPLAAVTAESSFVTPAGFLVAFDAASGTIVSARTIGGGGLDSASYVYPAISGGTDGSVANTPFVNMSSVVLDGVYGVAAQRNSAQMSVYVAAALSTDAPRFSSEPSVGKGNELSASLPRTVQSNARTRSLDAYVAQLTSTTLNLNWLLVVYGSGHDAALAVAADATQGGCVAAGGSTSQSVTWLMSTATAALPNPPTLTRTGGLAFGWALKLTEGGNAAWAVAFNSDTGVATAYGAAVDSASASLIAGSFSGSMTVMPAGYVSGFGTLLPALQASSGAVNAWVAKISATGTPLWSTALLGSGADVASRVAVDSADDVYLFGAFTSATLSAGSTSLSRAGGADAFTAKLNGTGDKNTPAGGVTWMQSYAGAGDERAFAGAVRGAPAVTDSAPGGNLLVAGTSFNPTGATSLVFATLCPVQITLPSVQSMGFLLHSPLSGSTCSSSGGGNGGSGPPSGSPPAGSPPAGSPPAGSPPAGSPPAGLPSLPPGYTSTNVPLSMGLSNPASFSATAVAAAAAAAMGLPSGAVGVTGGSGTLGFTFAFAGAAALPTSAQAAIATELVNGLSLPDASYVKFTAGTASGRRMQLLQLSGSSSVSVTGVPLSQVTLLSTFTSADIGTHLTSLMATSAPGLTIGTVQQPTYGVTLVLAIATATSSTTTGAAALAAAISSGALSSALTSAGAGVSGTIRTGCATSPCYPGGICADVANPATGASVTCTCPVGTAGDGFECANCGSLAAPTILPAFSSPLQRSFAASIFSSVPLPVSTAPSSAACNLGSGFSYEWMVQDSSSTMRANGVDPTLVIAPGALPTGAMAVQLRVCYANNSMLPCASASWSFSVVPTPLIAAISGGGALFSAGAAAALDASLSRDPDVSSAAGLSFAWACARAGGGACLTASGAPFALPAVASLPLSALAGGVAPGGAAYNFTLSIAKDSRTATASTSVVVVGGGATRPVVAIAALPVAAVNPSARTVLSATVTPAAAADVVALSWSVAPSSAASVDLSNPTVCSTPLTFSSLVLLPDAMAGSAVYTFRLTATVTSSANAAAIGSSAYAEIAVPTTVAYPQPGSLAPLATNGVALSTVYPLSAPGWSVAGGSSGDLPLQYSFAYQNASSPLAPEQAPVTVLTPFVPASTATALLPAGSLRILVFVQSARGATTSLATALATAQLVTVAPLAGPEAEYAPPIVAAAVAAAEAGQSDLTLQLAGGLATTFNAVPATDVGRTNSREALLAAVATSAAAEPPASPSGLQALAGALSALTFAPAELSPAARGAAVSALTGVAAAGAAVNRPTAQAVLFSLSNVSVSSVSDIAAANASAGLRDLKGVLGAVGNLSASLQAALSVPGEAPITLSSATIQAYSALDLTSPGSRLFTAPITAPGAGDAAFGALPAGALPPGLSAVNTSFHFMSFDPHSGAVNNGSGSARLLLTSAAAPVSVAGLAVPIQITLPALSAASLTTSSSASAGLPTAGVCTFWNSAQQVYSAEGCIGLPNPLPPGLTATFNASAAAAEGAGGAELTGAVVLGPAGHPLLSGCDVAVLDCAALGPEGVLFLDPSDPFGAPAVRCPRIDVAVAGLGGTAATSAPPLRVYYGSSCALWRPDNAARCAWNATSQAFAGVGCAATTGPEQCYCRHLTDFSSFAFPQIQVATPAQMLDISPLDIITKLRLFLCVICVLFGVMHLGAAIGATLDARGKASVLRALLSDRFAFQELPGGAWTWALYQKPVLSEFGAVEGPVVELAAIIGVPYARLRCAIPEELLAGDVAHTVGRAAGLSVEAAKAAADTHDALMATLFGTGCCAGSSDVASATPPGKGDDVAAADAAAMERPPWEADAESGGSGDDTNAAAAAARATSTALIFALLWVRMLLPRETLAARQAAAAAHFSRIRTVAGNFDDLVSRFKDLLSGGNLHVTYLWLDKARLWRMILLQDPAGFWDASPGLAFALQATSVAPGGASGRPVAWQRPVRALRALCGRGGDGGALEQSDDEADGGASPTSPASSIGTPLTPRSPTTPVALRDDPLHFSISAVNASMPRALRAATAAPPERVWATLLCIALAETLDNCWIVNGDASKEMLEEEVTLVDLAEAWLADTAAQDGVLRAALPRARAKAGRMTREWALAQEERVAALREFELSSAHRTGSLLTRLAGDVARALQTRHETFATFLAPPTEGLQRWQKWLLMLTAIIGGLTVEVWFYYSKADTCCRQIRRLIGCDEAPGTPCFSSGADCASLQDVFGDYASAIWIAAGATPEQALAKAADVAAYECHAFPDEDNPVDQFFVGLIFAATAIPLRYILTIMLAMSNEAEHNEAWVSLSPRDRAISRALGMRFSWHYADASRRPNLLLRLWVRWAVEPFNMAIDLLVNGITAAVLWCARVCGCGCGCGLRIAPGDADSDAAGVADDVAPAGEGEGATPSTDGVAPPPRKSGAVGGDAATAAAPRVSAAVTRTVRMRRASAQLRAPSTRSLEQQRRRSSVADASAANADDGVVETQEEIDAAMEVEFVNAVKARVVRATGMAGIYFTWGILTWFIFAYGLLIYSHLGVDAEKGFVRAWLVALGVDNASQWRDILKEALQGALVVVLLDRIWILPNGRWMEDHLDWMSVQATLLAGGALSRWRRLKTHLDYYAYVE